MENRLFSILVSVPFALVVIIWAASTAIHFKPGLSKREKEILGYTTKSRLLPSEAT